ncbi:MAG: COG4705 family protein [Minisyncoccia bacterium]
MSRRYLFRKVPQITAVFWIVKVVTTALGESTSDFLVYSINPYAAVGLGALVFVGALALQFYWRKYSAWVYWFAATMVAVFGTMAADVLHIVIGIPYLYTTAFFATALVIIFILWYTVEKTLSIHSITTPRRELFYWLTVCATFALGTAAGDTAAFTFNLGFLASGLLFAALITAVAILHYATKGWLSEHHERQTRNAVLAFWLAYILTRPLGASFADWFGKAPGIGGLGWGDGTVSLILTVLLVGLVWYLAATHIDVDRTRIG